MPRPSIRKRLILWTTILISIVLVITGMILYSSFRSSLYAQTDRFLDEAASVVLIEVEVKNNAVYHEWQEALEKNPQRSSETFIEVWDQRTNQSTRSPALGENSIERRSGALNERVFYDVTLPNGNPGRAVGILIYPTLEHPEDDPGFQVQEHPQIFVWAGNTTHLQALLNKTKSSFIIGITLSVLLLWAIVYQVTHRSLAPMQQINQAMSERRVTEIGNPITIPDDLPLEIVEMAESFNTLLARIDVSRQKDRDFFLNLAHELRTPIAGILTLTEQSLRNPRSAEYYEQRLQTILGSVEDIRNLISRLLKFGKINRGTEPIDFAPIDLSALIKKIQSSLESKAGSKALSFQNYFPSSPLIIKGDMELLRVVISNLLENATNYATHETSIISRIYEDHRGITLSFENSVATPLPEDSEIKRFFDPFYRQDKTRSRQEGHVGLGLSFCKDIVQALGGSIEAHRRDSDRLIFKLTLPESHLFRESFEI